MPVCIGCGGSYDSNFRFCPFCGRAKPEPETVKIQVSVSSTDKWETCKIAIAPCKAASVKISYYHTLEYDYLKAEGVGPKGVFIAGESFLYVRHIKWDFGDEELFSGRKLAYSFLVNQLVKDGWESTGTGAKWWEGEFRRRSEADNPLPWSTWEVTRVRTQKKMQVFRIERRSTENGNNFQVGPTSREFGWKGDWRTPDDSDIETPERVQVLNEFLHKLQGEGYELVPPSESEQMKKGRWETDKDLLKNWHFRLLLKREY